MCMKCSRGTKFPTCLLCEVAHLTILKTLSTRFREFGSFCIEVDVHKSNIPIKLCLCMLEWYVVRCGSKNWCQKDIVFKRDWITCSKNANHSRLNIGLDHGDLYDHLMRRKSQL